MSNIKIIFAQSNNGIIGANGTIPWFVPDDLKEFKEKTLNSTVLMGRKTWESLPEKMQPLPGRINLIASNDIKFATDIVKKYGSIYSRLDSFKQSVRNSIPSVRYGIEILLAHRFKHSRDYDELWVIGGKSIYEMALPYASEIHVTTILINVEGDVKAPEIDYNLFNVVEQSRIKHDTKTGIPFYTIVYKRK